MIDEIRQVIKRIDAILDDPEQDIHEFFKTDFGKEFAGSYTELKEFAQSVIFIPFLGKVYDFFMTFISSESAIKEILAMIDKSRDIDEEQKLISKKSIEIIIYHN